MGKTYLFAIREVSPSVDPSPRLRTNYETNEEVTLCSQLVVCLLLFELPQLSQILLRWVPSHTRCSAANHVSSALTQIEIGFSGREIVRY